jgi:hypothetical protein
MNGSRRFAKTGIAVAALAVALPLDQGVAQAQTFPDTGGATAVFAPLMRGGTAVLDDVGTGTNTDVVGGVGAPAVFLASDANDLFFRIRVNADPGSAGSFAPKGWGCLLDTDGDDVTFEYLVIVDGTHQVVSYRQNLSGGNKVFYTDTTGPALTELTTFPAATYTQSSVANTSFNGDADYFVDFAVPWATLRGGSAPIADKTELRFICGATDKQPDPDKIDADVAGDGAASGSATIAGNWSDRYLCNVGGSTDCLLDTDGDTVPDVTEALPSIGTSPTNPDSDGDGIPDAVELTPTGGGAFAGIDTDKDGTIDALDTDSDNDDVLDKDEGFVAGVAVDIDKDGIPNFRDTDDDNDTITTKDEVKYTKDSGVIDDVDTDGLKNWFDTDSNGNGIPDGVEGTGDIDGDGIPDFLDTFNEVKDAGPGDAAPVDAGPPDTGPPDAEPPVVDATAPPPPTVDASDAGAPPPAPDFGVAEGAGLFCDASPGQGSTPSALGLLLAALVLAARRTRAKLGGGPRRRP